VTKSKSRRPIAVIDCETDPFQPGRIPQPFLWGFYNGTDYFNFDTGSDLIDFLANKRYLVYAHNGGRFDYHYLLDYLEPNSSIMLIGGRIASFRIGQCEFRDSINILPIGLAQFQKTEIDYSIFERDTRDISENRQRIASYLKDDCVYLYQLITEFVNDYGIQITQASAAIRQWQKIAKQKPPRSDEDYYETYKKYYYGGRVQVFRRGNAQCNFSVFDINSAYPYAMLHKHPYNLSAFESDPKISNVLGSSMVHCRCISGGSLPYRGSKGELDFPSDNMVREYHCTGWELLAGLETGAIRDLVLLSVTNWTETIDFSEYVHKFYSLRLEAKARGDKARDIFAKIFLNGLYGKWASNPDRYRKYMICDPAQIDDGSIIQFDDDDFHIQGELGPWLLAARKLDDMEKRYYDVALGASITGFVRAYLWRALASCGVDNVLYCDTDSIATTRVGECIVEGSSLGQWKNEGRFVEYDIAGKKLYSFRGENARESKRASKGARLSAAEIHHIAIGGTVHYSPEVPTYSAKSGVFFTNRVIKQTGG
jgi:hypothetical protein